MNERLTKLESQLAFQENIIGELNEVVTGQQKQIDSLSQELQLLREELRRGRENDERDPRLEKPPHY